MTFSAVYEALHARWAFLPWLVLCVLALVVSFLIDRSGFDDWLEARYSWGKVATRTATRLPVVIFCSSFAAITLGRADVVDYVLGACCGLVGPLIDAIRKGETEKESLLLLLGVSCAGVPLTLPGCAAAQEMDPKFELDEIACIAARREEYSERKRACGDRRDAECSTDALIDWKTEKEIKCLETH